MLPNTNRQWRLKTRPDADVHDRHFEWTEGPVPDVKDGEFLVRNLYLSFDPTQRGWLNDVESYVPPVAIGEVMRAGSVGQVVMSRNPAFAKGDFVQGAFGWQDYAATDGKGIMPAMKIPAGIPITYPLGILGITGLTAYFGMLKLGRPKAGETVVVSAAAGATGSVAGQLAKMEGARVIGIAGGKDKCRMVTDEFGFDAAIDYKKEKVGEALARLAPGGVELYFDNVGGDILDSLFLNMAQGGRIVVCGGISSGYTMAAPVGPKNFMMTVIKRLKIEGFIVLDFLAEFPAAAMTLAGHVMSGKIKVKEDVAVGLENAPRTLNRLFRGENMGKQILKIADPPIAV